MGGVANTLKNWKGGNEKQKRDAVRKCLNVGKTIERLLERNNRTIDMEINEHWPSLYTVMKRARTDIVGTAGKVFGDRKSEYHLVQYAFPSKGPEVAGHHIALRNSLKEHMSLNELVDALKGNLRLNAKAWDLFVKGCFSGKIRGLKFRNAAVCTYSGEIGFETETLIRLELVKRFESQGFQWMKANDGRLNLRYHAFQTMKQAVSTTEVMRMRVDLN